MQKIHIILGIGLISCSTGLLAQDRPARGSQIIENLDSDGDGVISFEEFQDSRMADMSRLDEDQKEVLTIDEFLNGRPRGGIRDRDDSQRQQDLSEERQARILEMRERMEQRATEQFQRMDEDGDGQVSLDDFREQTFLNLDRNEDGVLNAKELRPRRGRPGGRARGGPRADRGNHQVDPDSQQ